VVAKLDRLVAIATSLNCCCTRSWISCAATTVCRPFQHSSARAVAEHEARQIAARTKAALAATKAKGRLLGSARPGHWDGRERGNKKRSLGSAPTHRKQGEVSAVLIQRSSAGGKRGRRSIGSWPGSTNRIQDTANEGVVAEAALHAQRWSGG